MFAVLFGAASYSDTHRSDLGEIIVVLGVIAVATFVYVLRRKK